MWRIISWGIFVPSTMTHNKHHKAMTIQTTTLTADQIKKSSATEFSVVSFSNTTDSDCNTVVNMLIDGKVAFTFSRLHFAMLSVNKMKKMGLGFGIGSQEASNFLERFC